MKYSIVTFFLFSLFILQFVKASPVFIEDLDEPALAKRFSTSATCPPGASCLHRRDVVEEAEQPALVKRGGHHHRWGFGKHGFKGMFRGFRGHHGRFW